VVAEETAKKLAVKNDSRIPLASKLKIKLLFSYG